MNKKMMPVKDWITLRRILQEIPATRIEQDLEKLSLEFTV